MSKIPIVRPTRVRFLGPIAIVLMLLIPAVGSMAWLASQSSIDSAPADVREGDAPTARASRAPEGPNRQLFVERCISCHSTAVIFRHPSLSESAWTAIVQRMILARNARVEPDEVRPIVEYLLAAGSSAGLR